MIHFVASHCHRSGIMDGRMVASFDHHSRSGELISTLSSSIEYSHGTPFVDKKRLISVIKRLLQLDWPRNHYLCRLRSEDPDQPLFCNDSARTTNRQLALCFLSTSAATYLVLHIGHSLVVAITNFEQSGHMHKCPQSIFANTASWS